MRLSPKQKILFFFLLLAGATNAQLRPASCVHGGGIPFLLDAYLGSIGACDCEKSGVILAQYYSCNTNPFELVFEDNFENDSLDKTKWQLVMAGQGGLNNSGRVELNTLNNLEFTGGICRIIAKKETIVARAVNWRADDEILPDGLPNRRTFYYTSSALWSKKTYLHGKYEIRCRMPRGNGFWPAFWTFGGERWNEIDVFDSYAGTGKLVTSIGHDFENNGKSNGCSLSYTGYDLAEWHVFTCIFEPEQISFLIDDELVRITPRVITAGGHALRCNDEIDHGVYYELKSYPVEPMHIIINMALMSENGPGASLPVDDSTPFPSAFEVDYVRYWKRTENKFTVFPNPAGAFATVQSQHPLRITIRLFNVFGVLVKTITEASTPVQVPLQGLEEGVYLMEIGYEGGTKNIKIIKTN